VSGKGDVSKTQTDPISGESSLLEEQEAFLLMTSVDMKVYLSSFLKFLFNITGSHYTITSITLHQWSLDGFIMDLTGDETCQRPLSYC